MARLAAMLVSIGLTAMGCASAGRGPREPQGPVCIPGAKAVPRVIVYGALGDLLPAWNDTPAIERFLYGPTPDQSAVSGLRNPQGITWLNGRLLVCDQGWPDVVAIDPAAGRGVSWADANHPPRCPVDIASDGLERVYVADTTLRSVVVYDLDGRFVDELRPAGGERDRQAFRPCSVLVHQGILYVGDLDGRRLARFDIARQAWLPAFSPPAREGPLFAPTGLCIAPGGELLVADAVRGVVHRVELDGRWLMAVGKPGRGAGEFVRPKQVCCTASRLILVSDVGRQSVLVFDAAGAYLFEIDARAGGWEGFSLPMGMVIVGPADAASWSMRLTRDGQPPPTEYVIVSDTLGGASLVVLGVVANTPEDRTNAR